MRFARFLLLTLVSAVPLLAGDVALVRVWTGPRTADSFDRISEYFDGQENTGGQTILRTQPGARAGRYWLIRTKAAVATDASIELVVLAPGTDIPRTHRLSTRLPAGSHVTMTGLTGADWPDPDVRPVAWKLRVLDAAGNELAAEQSFLWTAANPS